MITSSRALAVIVVSLVALAWAFYLFGGNPFEDDHRQSDLDEQSAPGAPPVVNKTPDSSGPIETTKFDQKQKVATICVKAVEDGAPITGAFLYWSDNRRRNMPRESVVEIGHTDENGRISFLPSFSKAGIDREFAQVGIMATGHVTSFTAPPEVGETKVVSVSRGHSLRIKCADLEGRSLGGVAIALSRSGVGSTYLKSVSQDCLPCGTEVHAVHRGRSGKDGVAVFSGLTPGSHNVRIVGTRWIPLQMAGIVSVSTRTTDQLDLTLAQIWVASCRAENDKVVWHRFNLPRVKGGDPKLSYAYKFEMMKVAHRLLNQDHYRGCLISPFMAGASLDPQDVDVDMLLAGSGMQRFRVRCMPLSELSPESVPVVRPKAVDRNTGEFTLKRVVGPDGADSALTEFVMTRLAPPNPRVFLALEIGRSYRLPAGTYEIRSNGPRFDKDVVSGNRFELNAGSVVENVLRMNRHYSRCRFVVVNSYGEDPGKIQVILSSNQGFGNLLSPIDNKVDCWLPTGTRWNAQIRCAGYDTIERTIVIPDGESRTLPARRVVLGAGSK